MKVNKETMKMAPKLITHETQNALLAPLM